MAADITWEDVSAIATELAEVDEEAQDIILAYANTALNEGAFKAAAYKLARILLAAHFATMTAASGGDVTAGPVLSETAGGLSRTYANMSSGGAAGGFSGSSYGDQLTYLIRTSRGRYPLVL